MCDFSGDGKRSGLFALGYLESEDGIHWLRPHRLLDGPPGMRWGASVIDEGPNWPTPATRFKFGGGLCVAASPDGLAWKPLAPGVVLEHNHDINCILRDPARNRDAALVSVYTAGASVIDVPGAVVLCSTLSIGPFAVRTRRVHSPVFAGLLLGATRTPSAAASRP